MVITPRLGLQPSYIGLSVVPTHIDDRPIAATPIRIGRLVAVAAAVRDASIRFVEAHRESAHRERLRNCHTMLRTFESSATLFAFWRAHSEKPRGDHHHLGAFAAILEDFARLISPVRRRIGECSQACHKRAYRKNECNLTNDPHDVFAPALSAPRSTRSPRRYHRARPKGTKADSAYIEAQPACRAFFSTELHSANLRNRALNLLYGISIGLRSGEYFGR